MTETKAPRKFDGGSTDDRTDAKLIPLHGRGRLVAPWAPGRSGNPLGTPTSAYNEARAVCAAASPEAARKLVELLNSQDERIVLMASEAVLNRAVGKPKEHPKQPSRIDFSSFSPEELASFVTLLKRALGR